MTWKEETEMKLLPKETHTWRCMSLIDKMKFYTDAINMYWRMMGMKFYTDAINMYWRMMGKELGWEYYDHKMYCGTYIKRKI